VIRFYSFIFKFVPLLSELGGYTTFALKEIIDHRTDGSALTLDDAYTVTKTGEKQLQQTTKGWQLCVHWNYEPVSWVALKDLKDSDPIKVAEYAVNMKIALEPAFAWWVPHTLKKRHRIIKAMKKHYFKREQKYGIELPKTVKQALEIDEETGTTFWKDSIWKEMKAVGKAFQLLDEGAPDPVAHTRINVHMVFDIKADFTRKSRLVTGGHMTDPPASITYASVVSRESVRIAFLIVALNDLDILAAGIGNAYLNAPVREKIFIVCGREFRDDLVGRKAIIVRALYGLKSSGAAWRACLAEVPISWVSNHAGPTTMCGSDLHKELMERATMSMCWYTRTTHYACLVTPVPFFAT
jgi:Reverse transcriptase (RNA-dependent DNA polymerase)